MTRPEPTALVAELRGSAEGSTSACASLMRDAADAIERLMAAAELLAQAGVAPEDAPTVISLGARLHAYGVTGYDLDEIVLRGYREAAEGCTCGWGGHRTTDIRCEKNREGAK